MMVYIFTGWDSMRLDKVYADTLLSMGEKNNYCGVVSQITTRIHRVVTHSTHNQPEWRDFVQYWGNSLEIPERPCLKN